MSVPAPGGAPWIYAALLGLGLAASCGLNTFLPLLMLAAAARLHLAGVHLNGAFAWLASDTALIALAGATVIEVIADKVPAVDHALHLVGTVARPAAGALAAASVFQHSDPATAALAGLIIGAPTALGFHGVKAGTRVASSAATLGLANPLLSLLEDLMSAGLVVVSLAAPLLIPLVLVLTLAVLWQMVKFARKRLPLRRGAPGASTS